MIERFACCAVDGNHFRALRVLFYGAGTYWAVKAQLVCLSNIFWRNFDEVFVFVH